jgi:hypothetical protein
MYTIHYYDNLGKGVSTLSYQLPFTLKPATS